MEIIFLVDEIWKQLINYFNNHEYWKRTEEVHGKRLK